MSTPGAMRRQPEPEDPAALIAAHCARADATLDQLKGVLDMLAGGQCGKDTPLWLQDTCNHLWEYREQVAKAVASFPAIENAIEMGRQLERAEQAARPRARSHRHARPSRLRVVGTTVATSGIAASLATTTWAATQDTGSTHHVWLPSPAAALHAAALPSDTASLIPQGSPARSFSSPRPSTAVRTAKPVATPSPSPSSPVVTEAPAQPAPAPTQVAPPALTVSVRDLVLTGTSGTFQIAATGTEGTAWSVDVSGIPGATVDVSQGILTSAQQPVTITLTDPEGLAGFVYVKWDGGGITAIWVTPAGS